MDSAANAIPLLTLLLVAAVCSSCGMSDQQSPADQKPFWFTHCEGAEFRNVTKNPTYGDSKPGVIVRINNNLIFAPPTSVFPHYMGDDAKGPECTSINDLPEVTNASFQIRASTLRGPDPTTNKGFDPDIVSVYVMPKIQAPAFDPSVAEQNEQASYEDSKYHGQPVEKTNEYGLRCYGYPRVLMRCFGSTTDGASPDVVISVLAGMAEGLHAQYYSPKYGGIGISWLAGTENLPRWKAIAGRIFADLDDWNARQQDSLDSASQAVVRH